MMLRMVSVFWRHPTQGCKAGTKQEGKRCFLELKGAVHGTPRQLA